MLVLSSNINVTNNSTGMNPFIMVAIDNHILQRKLLFIFDIDNNSFRKFIHYFVWIFQF